jgi:segregation and condensation protein A
MEENSSVYVVKTEGFEGPFELLLQLIEKRKLFVNDVSLAEVTQDYISIVNSLDTVELKDKTAFIVIASILVLIKSKSLLPKLVLTSDEEGEVKDLENRLKLYDIVKERIPVVQEYFTKHILFPRATKIRKREIIFTPDTSISQSSIAGAIDDVLRALPKDEKPKEHFIEKVMSLESMIENLVDRIQEGMKTNFSSLVGDSDHETNQGKKVHTIVSFLAVLELVRQGMLDAHQDDSFSDIGISKQAAM